MEIESLNKQDRQQAGNLCLLEQLQSRACKQGATGNCLTKGQSKCWNSSNVPYQLTYVYHDCAWTQVMDWDGLLSMYSPWPPMYTNRTLIILAKPSPWRSLHHKGTRRCMWIPPQRPGETLSFFQARKIAHLSLTAAVTLKREYEAEKEHGSESSQSSISYISYTH